MCVWLIVVLGLYSYQFYEAGMAPGFPKRGSKAPIDWGLEASEEPDRRGS